MDSILKAWKNQSKYVRYPIYGIVGLYLLNLISLNTIGVAMKSLPQLLFIGIFLPIALEATRESIQAYRQSKTILPMPTIITAILAVMMVNSFICSILPYSIFYLPFALTTPGAIEIWAYDEGDNRLSAFAGTLDAFGEENDRGWRLAENKRVVFDELYDIGPYRVRAHCPENPSQKVEQTGVTIFGGMTNLIRLYGLDCGVAEVEECGQEGHTCYPCQYDSRGHQGDVWYFDACRKPYLKKDECGGNKVVCRQLSDGRSECWCGSEEAVETTTTIYTPPTTIPTAVCGGYLEACCSGNQCNSPLICQGGRCDVQATATHLECIGNQCREVVGAGPNQCTIDGDCYQAPATTVPPTTIPATTTTMPPEEGEKESTSLLPIIGIIALISIGGIAVYLYKQRPKPPTLNQQLGE
jgi:hypothetical protein